MSATVFTSVSPLLARPLPFINYHDTKMTSPTRYYLGLRNLSKNLTVETISSKFTSYPSISGLKILPGSTRKDKTAEVSSTDKNEIIAAAKSLQEREDWSWNNGFRARVEVYTSKIPTPISRHVIKDKLFTHRPEFIGENINDVPESFRPGFMVQFPHYKQRRMGVEIDRRLRNQVALYGHPAIIVHNHGVKNLVNIILCTDLNGQSVHSIISGHREESIRRALEKRIMEVATDKRLQSNEKSNLQTCLLEFEGGNLLHSKNKIYAEATVYTVDLRALARLESSFIYGHPTEAFGYTRLAEFWTLSSQLKKAKMQMKEMHPTELRGTDLSKLSYMDRLLVIQRMKQDAAKERAERGKMEREEQYMSKTAEKRNWRLPGKHPEEIMRWALRKTIHVSEVVRKVQRGTSVKSIRWKEEPLQEFMAPIDSNMSYRIRRQPTNTRFRAVNEEHVLSKKTAIPYTPFSSGEGQDAKEKRDEITDA